MKRRSLLVMATLAGGGLVAGCASPARQQLRGSAMAAQAGQVALNGWVKVGTDGMVTAVMGQGVHTALIPAA